MPYLSVTKPKAWGVWGEAAGGKRLPPIAGLLGQQEGRATAFSPAVNRPGPSRAYYEVGYYVTYRIGAPRRVRSSKSQA